MNLCFPCLGGGGTMERGWCGSIELWWLILCVRMTELRNTQVAGETLFLGLSVKVFPEEINIWVSKCAFCLSWDTQLLLLWHTSVPGPRAFRLMLWHLPWLPWFSGLQVGMETAPLAFLGLQLAGDRLCDLTSVFGSLTCEPILHNKYLFQYIYTYPVGSVFLDNPD